MERICLLLGDHVGGGHVAVVVATTVPVGSGGRSVPVGGVLIDEHPTQIPRQLIGLSFGGILLISLRG